MQVMQLAYDLLTFNECCLMIFWLRGQTFCQVKPVVLRSWDGTSFMYSSKTNKMQRYTMVFITINDLHVLGGFSAHHQELKTVYTASGICRAYSVSYRYRSNSLTIAIRSRKSLTNTRFCV
jgi:hypothetical protein